MKDLYKNYKDEKGNIKSFKEQLLEFEYGVKDFYYPFLVSINSDKLQYAEIEEKPLMINVSTVQKLKVKHELDLKFLINLEKVTKNSVFAFDSIQHETSKIFVTNEKNNNYPIIFIIRRDDKESHISINRITSVYDKKNLQNLIDRTLGRGGSVYINSEKQKEFEKMGYDISLKEMKKSEEEKEYYQDSDKDGLTDKEEKEKYFTDPYSLDSDGDGRSDYQEIKEDYTNANDINSRKIDFRYKNTEKEKDLSFKIEK